VPPCLRFFTLPVRFLPMRFRPCLTPSLGALLHRRSSVDGAAKASDGQRQPMHIVNTGKAKTLPDPDLIRRGSIPWIARSATAPRSSASTLECSRQGDPRTTPPGGPVRAGKDSSPVSPPALIRYETLTTPRPSSASRNSWHRFQNASLCCWPVVRKVRSASPARMMATADSSIQAQHVLRGSYRAPATATSKLLRSKVGLDHRLHSQSAWFSPDDEDLNNREHQSSTRGVANITARSPRWTAPHRLIRLGVHAIRPSVHRHAASLRRCQKFTRPALRA